MNLPHNLICSSGWWARRVERKLLPSALGSLELGDDVLEFGPGFGATTRVLARRLPKLTVLELEENYCRRLQAELGERVQVVKGDATRMPFAAGRFSAVLCFTMLHHIPSRELQDTALAEAFRVLRPGGAFAGTDSLGGGLLFRAIHIGDRLNLVAPEEFGSRLESAGFRQPAVELGGRSFRFQALKPGPHIAVSASPGC